MQLKTLRQSLSPALTELTNAADYWSEMTMRGKSSGNHYIKIIKQIEELKTYIIESERNDDEELRLPSRTNGRLHKAKNETLEDSGVELFG